MAQKVTRRLVRVVEKRLGSATEFVLARPIYCREARDRIASVCYPDDICREIDVFRSAGYSDAEIEAIYRELREHGTVTLSRPVHVRLTVSV